MRDRFAGSVTALALLLAADGALADVAAPKSPPQRIVSLNLCVDQILVDLVPRGRIAALTHLATDPDVSAVVEQARGIPSTRGEAEVVLGLDPDLVIAGPYGVTATVSMLERLGRRVVKVQLANDLDGVRESVREVAAAVGETVRGETVIADFDARLTRAAVGHGTAAPSALVYQVNSLASGPGSLDDAVLRAAGYRNHSAVLGLGRGGGLPLEALVANPPDLLVLSGPVEQHRTVVAENLRHPALAAVRRARPSVVLPWRTFLCGTPHVADAVEQLSAARRDVAASRNTVRTP